MSSPSPPERVIHSSSVMVAIYGFSDASGAGFGSTITSSTGDQDQNGIWGDDLGASSSNYRELFNLTEAAEAISTMVVRGAPLIQWMSITLDSLGSCRKHCRTSTCSYKKPEHRNEATWGNRLGGNMYWPTAKRVAIEQQEHPTWKGKAAPTG